MAGGSLLQIARSLESEGILTVANEEKWRPETLRKILQSEKYIGDVLLQKTYMVNFLNKKRVQNNIVVLQYYVENSHPPIIPRDLYIRVQGEMMRRANLHSGEKRRNGFTAASTPYPVSFIVRNAATFTIGLPGITVESILQSGGAASVWSMDRPPVTHRLSKN